jgi:phage tail-like protein
MMVNAEGKVNFVGEALLAGYYAGMKAKKDGTLHVTHSPGHWLASYDSGSENTVFGRLVLWGELEGARYEVLAASTNNPVLSELDALLGSDAPLADKRAALMQLEHRIWTNASDLLLTALPGQVLYVLVTIWPDEGPAPVLEGLSLTVPWQPFTSYLPEIYAGNDFFDRFVGIFQSIYLDLEARVDGFPRQLDYLTATDDNLRILASWLGIADPLGLYSTAQMRQLIAAAGLLQAGKGTRAALEAAVELTCGVRPRIIEYFEWAGAGLPHALRPVYGSLYGESADDFTVIVPGEGAGGTAVDAGGLRWLIEQNTPLGARAQLVVLGAASHIDTHCYLDVNCTLNTPALAMTNKGRLDGDVSLA